MLEFIGEIFAEILFEIVGRIFIEILFYLVEYLFDVLTYLGETLRAKIKI